MNGAEKLYALKQMREFRVYCHFFGRRRAHQSVHNLCENNRRTVTSLGLRFDGSLPADDWIPRSVAMCTQLKKLDLVGGVAISWRGLQEIASLPKLQRLKLEIAQIRDEHFARFLRLPFAKRLVSLSIRWSRPVSADEVLAMENCQSLRQLSCDFGDSRVAAHVLEAVRNMDLRKFKVKSADFQILPVLRQVCFCARDLFYVKLTLYHDKIDHEMLREMLSTFSSLYSYKWSVGGADLEIKFRKKTNIELE